MSLRLDEIQTPYFCVAESLDSHSLLTNVLLHGMLIFADRTGTKFYVRPFLAEGAIVKRISVNRRVRTVEVQLS